MQGRTLVRLQQFDEAIEGAGDEPLGSSVESLGGKG
jgi:hypothetical protein